MEGVCERRHGGLKGGTTMLRNWCASGFVEYYNEWIPLDRMGRGTTTEIDRSLADHWMAIAKYFLDPRITRL